MLAEDIAKLMAMVPHEEAISKTEGSDKWVDNNLYIILLQIVPISLLVYKLFWSYNIKSKLKV